MCFRPAQAVRQRDRKVGPDDGQRQSGQARARARIAGRWCFPLTAYFPRSARFVARSWLLLRPHLAPRVSLRHRLLLKPQVLRAHLKRRVPLRCRLCRNFYPFMAPTS